MNTENQKKFVFLDVYPEIKRGSLEFTDNPEKIKDLIELKRLYGGYPHPAKRKIYKSISCHEYAYVGLERLNFEFKNCGVVRDCFFSPYEGLEKMLDCARESYSWLENHVFNWGKRPLSADMRLDKWKVQHGARGYISVYAYENHFTRSRVFKIEFVRSSETPGAPYFNVDYASALYRDWCRNKEKFEEIMCNIDQRFPYPEIDEAQKNLALEILEIMEAQAEAQAEAQKLAAAAD